MTKGARSQGVCKVYGMHYFDLGNFLTMFRGTKYLATLKHFERLVYIVIRVSWENQMTICKDDRRSDFVKLPMRNMEEKKNKVRSLKFYRSD